MGDAVALAYGAGTGDVSDRFAAMEPIVFVMAILGCGDAGDLCREARIEPVRYTSIQACQAAQTDALRRNGDLDYPTIGTNCRAAGQRWAAADRKPRG